MCDKQCRRTEYNWMFPTSFCRSRERHCMCKNKKMRGQQKSKKEMINNTGQFLPGLSSLWKDLNSVLYSSYEPRFLIDGHALHNQFHERISIELIFNEHLARQWSHQTVNACELCEPSRSIDQQACDGYQNDISVRLA